MDLKSFLSALFHLTKRVQLKLIKMSDYNELTQDYQKWVNSMIAGITMRIGAEEEEEDEGDDRNVVVNLIEKKAGMGMKKKEGIEIKSA